jgi:hypothetical protein
MRSAQDRSTEESQRLSDRIGRLESRLEEAIDARVKAEGIAEQERAAASKARLAAEPRITAWAAMESEVDELEIED